MKMKFNEGNIFLEIGPFTITWYAILILSGAMVALYLAIKEGKKIGVSRDFLVDLCIFGLPISVVGARIYYVIFEWDYYRNNLGSIIKTYEGGLAIHGAVIFAVIWGYFFSKAKGVNFLKALDLGFPGFLVAQAIGRWGNFMNQEAHGGVVPGTTIGEQRSFLEGIGIPQFVIDKMYIAGSYYHPTFFYESLWNLLGLIFMLILRRTKYLYLGDLALVYMMWYSLGRGIIEGMRTDSLYIGATGIRTAQLVSALLFITGAVIFVLRHLKKWYPTYYYQVLEDNKPELSA